MSETADPSARDDKGKGDGSSPWVGDRPMAIAVGMTKGSARFPFGIPCKDPKVSKRETTTPFEHLIDG